MASSKTKEPWLGSFGFGSRGLGFRAWGSGLGFKVRVEGLGFRVRA